MVDKVLDKLGIYDLIGVLLPGVIASAISLIIDEALLQFGMNQYLNTDNLLVFLIISYFVGVVLQELGSILMKCCYGGEKLLKKALNPLDNSRERIPKQEWELIISYVKEKMALEEQPSLSLVYNYCKNSGGNSTLADKDHSVAAMSRSMAVYFALLSLFFLGILCIEKEVCVACYLCGAVTMMILMWKRSVRFYIIRYIRIMRAYYYQSVKDNHTKKNV